MMLRIAAAALAVLIASTAVAQQPHCAPRDAIIAKLETKFGESLIGRGLTVSGGVLEFFANPASGTFSAVLSQPQAWGVVSCLVTAGQDWQIIAPMSLDDPA